LHIAPLIDQKFKEIIHGMCLTDTLSMDLLYFACFDVILYYFSADEVSCDIYTLWKQLF